MLPTKILLALSGFLSVYAYKIEIDVQDDSITQMNDQIPVINDEPVFNTTIEGPESQQLGPFMCPSGTCAGSATCKAGDKTIRLSSDGSPYFLHCGKGIYNNKFNKNEVIEPSFESCINTCNDLSWCMAVNYETATKKCWRLSNYNYPGGDNTRWEAALKMTTTRKAVASCPESDGQLIKTASKTYRIHCDYDLPGSDLFNDKHQTFEGAAERCDATPGCIAVVRHYKDGNSYFKSTFAVPPKPPTKAQKVCALLIPVTGVSQKACCGSAQAKSALEVNRYDEL